jgi:SSS family solute:Na+ symporter
MMFIMGPSYWCTDFLLIQRALAAKDLNAARMTPLIAAFPKMLFPALVTLPGMVAAIVIPAQLDGNYNLALPGLMNRYYPNGLLGLGFTALLASFMSGMAGNVTAFNTVWTYDLYQSYLVKNRPDAHYLRVGRIATIAGTALSIAAAYIVLLFDNLMDYMQLIGTIFISPFFVIFLLGMFSKRITPSAAFWGMVSGVGGCLGQYTLFRMGIIHYRTAMDATFHLAIWGGLSGLVVTILVSMVTRPKPAGLLDGLVYERGAPHPEGALPWHRKPEVVAVAVLALLGFLNFIFR